ncbi:MAG: LysR family transcriptional regulator, partial [Alphaproteobacteria bacterium]|nr:LysR family transcriptional regulator [Alphaproteobacteria bacterium]
MFQTELRAFHAVAVEGSFTRAAARLGVTQPTLSAQVKAIEERSGAALFDRIGRRIALTDLGRRLLDVTQRLADAEAAAAELIGDARALRTGRLRVAADSPYHVAPLLAAFHARYAGVQAVLTIGNADAVREDLLRFAADVAVLADPAEDPRLHAVPCGRHPIVVVVPREHPWARRRLVRLAELAGRPMVLREPGSVTRRLFEARLAAAGVQPRIVMEIESREAVREAVAAGIGLGVVSEAEFGADGRLAMVPVDDPGLV